MISSGLQGGSSDLDNLCGTWPLANKEMAAALRYSGYDYKFVLGDDGRAALFFPNHYGG